MARRILATLMLVALGSAIAVLVGQPVADAVPTAAATPAAAAPTASATAGVPAPMLNAAASALRTRDVYVAPGAPPVDQARLAAGVGALTGPSIKVAVLPASAAREVGGNPAALPGQLSFLIGQGGTVVVLAGQQIFAASTVVNGADLDAALAAAGPAAASGDAQARTGALLSVAESGSVGRLGYGEASSAPARAGTPGGGDTALVAVAVVAAAGAIALVAAWWRRRRLGPAAERVDVDMLGRIIDIRPDVGQGTEPQEAAVDPVSARHRQEDS